MNILIIIIPLLLFISVIGTAQAQTPIVINSTQPCFLNYTAGVQLWKNCGFDKDFLKAALLPWEWITGGYFSMIFVSIMIFITYVKYHKAAYPMMVGVLYLPVAYYIFPESFVTFAVILMGLALGILLWYVILRQTKEYG